MTVYFFKTRDKNGLNCLKSPMRSSDILKIANVDKSCFQWSILAYLHPCNIHHPNRVSSYRQYFLMK